MTEKAVRKTTTKKPVRKTAPKKAASKSVATKKPAIKKTVTKTAARKAPTPVAAQKADSKMSNQIRIVSVVVFLLIVGGSIALGISGDGQISIEGTLLERKAAATPEERKIIDSVSIQKKNTANVLVPSGVPVEVPASEPVATSTDASASSTDATASSTDAVLEDVVSDENLESDLQEELPQERQEEIIEE